MKTYKDFTAAYIDIAKDLNDNAEYVASPRGQKVKEIIGYQFRLSNPLARIPFVKARDFSIHYIIAELLWYLSGNDSTSWISNYSAFWSKISDNGTTANSAYGSRIFKPHDRIAQTLSSSWTQWNYVIQELKNDPDSRRAVIHIRSPQDSILANLDVPCTLSLQFFLRDEKVHMVTSMRSSDLILGLAYDVPAFTIFQELLALELTTLLQRKIGLGTYTHLSASMHVYEKHYNMLEKIANGQQQIISKELLEMPVMPSMPPIDVLFRAEKELRLSSTTDEVIKTFNTAFESNLIKEKYWFDWYSVLASHRVLKLGDASLSNELLKNVNYNGYSFFMKEDKHE